MKFQNIEINNHFRVVPYLDLGIEGDLQFDHQKCLEEAKAVLEGFVTHRPYHQYSENEAQWKSLALRAIDGDPTKTKYHNEYGVVDGVDTPNYQMTEIAERCPTIINFLKTLVPIERCYRIRLMLLEPGAQIAVHRDSETVDPQLALNVALNMPTGCRFYVDVNPDGSENMYTRQVPFRDGSAFLFNNGKYHKVVNDSDQPRIHVLAHGPFLWPEEKVLSKLRVQNKVKTHKKVLQKLVCKKVLTSQFDYQSELFHEWCQLGWGDEVYPEKLKIVLLHHELEDKERQKQCLLMTLCCNLYHKGVIGSENIESIPFSQFDNWLNDQSPDQVKYVMAIATGTYFPGEPQSIVELLESLRRLHESQAMVLGHIMNRKDDLPFLHEQFFVLDLEKWQKAGQPQFGPDIYNNGNIDFADHLVSKKCIHDDYTPLYLNPSKDEDSAVSTEHRWVKGQSGRRRWGTEALSASLAMGFPIINVHEGLRNLKTYAYPEDTSHPGFKEIKKKMDRQIRKYRRKIFYLNTEPLRTIQLENFAPKHLIAVAGGIKFAGLLQQYWPDTNPESVTIVDQSEKALNYVRGFYGLSNWNEIIDYIFHTVIFETREQFFLEEKDQSAWWAHFKTVLYKIVRKHPPESWHKLFSTLSRDSIRNYLRSELTEAFNGNLEVLIKNFSKMKTARYKKIDFLEAPQKLVESIPGPGTLVWHSNVWQTQHAHHIFTQQELGEQYRQLIVQVTERFQTKAWRCLKHESVVIGDSPTEPQILLSGSGVEWRPLTSPAEDFKEWRL